MTKAAIAAAARAAIQRHGSLFAASRALNVSRSLLAQAAAGGELRDGSAYLLTARLGLSNGAQFSDVGNGSKVGD